MQTEYDCFSEEMSWMRVGLSLLLLICTSRRWRYGSVGMLTSFPACWGRGGGGGSFEILEISLKQLKKSLLLDGIGR